MFTSYSNKVTFEPRAERRIEKTSSPPTGYIYLACPYSHPDPAVVNARYEYATAVAVHLMLQGEVIFSPLSHTHNMRGVPNTWEFWSKQDLPMVTRAKELRVLTIPGWGASVGVQAEIKHAQTIGRRVTYLDPASLPEPLNRQFPIP